ncbi:hypothetical protein XENTR_v10002063 [Xenopus tropicalis]|nr:hypothetical protein XENTR_v10002063 [Xenopus tropicalis]
MFWYIQPENGAIQFLASGYDGTKEAGTFNMILKPDERFTSIEKSKIEPRDAATYYCAVRDTVLATARAAFQKPNRVLIPICAKRQEASV